MKITIKCAILLACLIGAMPLLAKELPSRLILVIGDGMGMEFVTAYRHYKQNPDSSVLERTLFDQWLLGMSATHPHDHQQVTDSAASATAFSAGVKSFNGAIGVDHHGNPVETVLERAKKHGYTTAMVATSQINHATPASFAAHIDSRHKYDEIADQYLDRRYQEMPWVDVLIGGGTRYFVREDRNLVKGFMALGYQYADNFGAFSGLTRAPALALLAAQGLPYAIDGDMQDRLTVMARKALALMPADKPFFMMIESSQIDWCGHANDIACAMREMADTEAMLYVLKDYADKHPGTLIVVTADHSTGGLSIGADGVYRWRPEVVKNVTASAGVIAKTMKANAKDWHEHWQALTALRLDDQQKKSLQTRVKSAAKKQEGAAGDEADDQLLAEVLSLINRASHTGWTSSGHTGGDVPVMAYGPGREAFIGFMDNTDIAKKLFALLPESSD
ncbi:MAG TPA: alkaline phosphatase [Cellvibrionaceae bacterium]